MSKSTLRPMPSPNGTNYSQQFLRMSVVSADELAQDAEPSSKRLYKALKAKFPDGPAEAMARLGLDMLLLRDENPSMHEEKESSEYHGRFDPRGPGGGGEIIGGRERRGEDRHRRRRADDHDPPIEPPSPEQNRGEDDWHMSDDEYEDFANHLREHGMNEDTIKVAVDYHRRRNGHDHRRSGRDCLPERVDVQDRAKGKMPTRAGHFSKPRFNRDHEIADTDKIVDHGLDAEESFAKRWPEIARIERDYEARDLSRDSRRRHAMDAKPAMTEARKQKLYQRYPGLERLDV